MNVNTKLKLSSFFLTLAEWDRHIEVIRQVLNSIQNFEPYAAFLRLSMGKGTPITPIDIKNFMELNGIEININGINLIVRLFDTRFVGSLDFEDFLKMILSRDNPDNRFDAALRPNYEVEFGENLSEEIEYTLARFFSKACEFLARVIRDSETKFILHNDGIFRLIDMDKSGFLDFDNLSLFFHNSKIKPRDSEIIAILRLIDINDDGKIAETEFKYFISLFSGEEPSSIVLQKLKTLRLNGCQFNYFGEKISEIMPLRQSKPSHHKESGRKLQLGNEGDEYAGQKRMQKAVESVKKAIVFHDPKDDKGGLQKSSSQRGFIKVEEVGKEEVKGILRQKKSRILSTHEFVDVGSYDNSIIIEEATEEGSPFSSGRLQSTSTRRVRVEDINNLAYNKSSRRTETYQPVMTPDKIPLLKLSQIQTNQLPVGRSTLRSVESYSPSPPRAQMQAPSPEKLVKVSPPRNVQVLQEKINSSYKRRTLQTQSYHNDYKQRIKRSPNKLKPSATAVQRSVVTFEKESKASLGSNKFYGKNENLEKRKILTRHYSAQGLHSLSNTLSYNPRDPAVSTRDIPKLNSTYSQQRQSHHASSSKNFQKFSTSSRQVTFNRKSQIREIDQKSPVRTNLEKSLSSISRSPSRSMSRGSARSFSGSPSRSPRNLRKEVKKILKKKKSRKTIHRVSSRKSNLKKVKDKSYYDKIHSPPSSVPRSQVIVRKSSTRKIRSKVKVQEPKNTVITQQKSQKMNSSTKYKRKRDSVKARNSAIKKQRKSEKYQKENKTPKRSSIKANKKREKKSVNKWKKQHQSSTRKSPEAKKYQRTSFKSPKAKHSKHQSSYKSPYKSPYRSPNKIQYTSTYKSPHRSPYQKTKARKSMTYTSSRRTLHNYESIHKAHLPSSIQVISCLILRSQQKSLESRQHSFRS